jgi:formylglycine-generating enzyme required for sulfatase activity
MATNKPQPNRVGRGGSWFVNAGYCRTAFRGSYRPVYGSDDFGFRPVLKPTTLQQNDQ